MDAACGDRHGYFRKRRTCGQSCCRLRFADDIIDLRARSLNIFNGMISLNFSCDGSHYLSHEEFSKEDLPF